MVTAIYIYAKHGKLKLLAKLGNTQKSIERDKYEIERGQHG